MKPKHSTSKVFSRLLICVVVGLITSIGITWIAASILDTTGYWKKRTPLVTAKLTTKKDTSWAYIEGNGLFFSGIISSLHFVSEVPSFGIPAKKTVKPGPQWSIIHKEPLIKPEESYKMEETVDLVNYQMPAITWEAVYVTMSEEAWGWPMVCMKSMQRSKRVIGTTNQTELTIVSGIPIGDRSHSLERSNLIPTQPIWIGLLANTLMYAFLSWISVMFYIRLRTFIRRKRGSCTICGYNIRDLQVCPECGKDPKTSL